MGGAEQLRAALAGVLADVRGRDITPAVRRLVASYQATGTAPVLDASATTAYAAYRMPATYAAVRAALAQLPDLAPASLLDVGGGTGAAAWAALDRWPTLVQVRVLDRSRAALDLGRRLAATASWPALRSAQWLPHDVRDGLPEGGADVLTAAYLLTELPERTRTALVDVMAAGGPTVVVVEPGTPAGYRTILAARERLLAAGLHVLAPCPHGDTCPLADQDDWCHMAARLERSALHRQVKGGALGYEDEKFSYVAASRVPVVTAAGRVLRHPQIRKGFVGLTVCRADGVVAPTPVPRRDPDYRAARDVDWGDPWPPAPG